MNYRKFFALIPALMLCAAPTLSQAAFGIAVSVNIAPPILPVYVQPPLPAVGYMWTPGYWAWDGNDYYWVPGTWVEPPQPGYLWTPGYWGWNDGVYAWNEGYWGTQIGFYGGVNYGFGYGGVGFEGGYWHGGAFFYNRAVANFGHVNIVNVYNTPVAHVAMSHVSFNGGEGGIRAQPTPAERTAMSQHHIAPTSMQAQQQQHAAALPAAHFHQNGGHPQVLSTARAGDFSHPGPGGTAHSTARPAPVAHQAPRPQSQSMMRPAPQPEAHAQPAERAPAERAPPERAPPEQHAEAPRPQAQPHEQAARPQPQPQPQKEQPRSEPDRDHDH